MAKKKKNATIYCSAFTELYMLPLGWIFFFLFFFAGKMTVDLWHQAFAEPKQEETLFSSVRSHWNKFELYSAKEKEPQKVNKAQRERDINEWSGSHSKMNALVLCRNLHPHRYAFQLNSGT